MSAQTDTIVLEPVPHIGLRQFQIHSLLIGEDGKLWLNTDKGFASYDGNEVMLSRENPATILKSNIANRNLYYLVAGLGIYTYNSNTDNMTYQSIKVPFEDSSLWTSPLSYADIFFQDGVLWGGRYDLGLLKYDTARKVVQTYDLFSKSTWSNTVRCIKPDKQYTYRLWLGTTDGIYSFDKRTNTLYRNYYASNKSDSTESDLNVFEIDVKDTNEIWFTAAGKGVGKYDIKSGQYTFFPYSTRSTGAPDKIVDWTILRRRNDNEYFIACENSPPAIFNTLTHQYSFNIRFNKRLPSLNFRDLRLDKAGNLWCVVFGQLYKAKLISSFFETIHFEQEDHIDKEADRFSTVQWNPVTKKYYAAFNNCTELFVFDSLMNKSGTIPFEGGDERELELFDIVVDGNGELWAAANKLYVHRKNRMIPAERVYPKLKFGDRRFQNLLVRNNHIYLQPMEPSYAAIYRIDTRNFSSDSIPFPFPVNSGEPPAEGLQKLIDVVVVDKQEKYAYVGTGEHVFQINLSTGTGRKVDRVRHKEFHNFFNLYWYNVDDYNRIWISSGSGFRVYDPETLALLKKITRDPQDLYQMTNAEGKGFMCAALAGGVSLFDYKNDKEYRLGLSDGLNTLFNSGIIALNDRLFVGANSTAVQYLDLNSIFHAPVERNSYLSKIEIFNKPLESDTLPEYISALTLPHNKNFITFTISSTEFDKQDKLEYRYKLVGVNNEWVTTNHLNRTISYADLRPGVYRFFTSVKNQDGTWIDNPRVLRIVIKPAWWQSTWFNLSIQALVLLIVVGLVHWRIRSVRKSERLKASIERERFELEAKALRAQMNPHFIFNCMNSIKSLIQSEEREKAVSYLTTFSKLIRTIFQNSDKKEVSLFDELETCRLYTYLESMRLGEKLDFEYSIQENLDLKSVHVPALILQPFIENAIWHGIVPKNGNGSLFVSVEKQNGSIKCVVEDDGIGRSVSQQNKFSSSMGTHQSKGVRLTQARMELNNNLNYQHSSIEIIDKKNAQNEPTGTKVILTINES